MNRPISILLLTTLLLTGCATGNDAARKEAELPKALVKQMQSAKPEGIKGPIGERYVLDNGMVLLVKENRALPVVMVNMIIKAGALRETPDKAGLAHMTAGLLTKGAAGMGATEISEAIEFVGGSLSVGAETDYATAGLSVLKKDADAGFALLARVLTQPDFKPEEIDRLKKALKAGIIRGEQDPGTVASKAYQKAVFGWDSAYGRPPEGTVESLDAIARADITAFHKNYYAPNNSIIAVVGDISADEAKALIAKHLGEWQKKKIEPPQVSRAQAPSEVKYIKINRDITQANILMGHPGVTREDPDYYTLYVMNYILGGGGFASRILDKIRDDLGLAYSAYSYFAANKYDGSYTVGMETKNKTADQAIEETIKLVERIRTEPVTDKEIQDAKDYITGSFARKMDTNAKIAGLMTQVEFYGLPFNYFEYYEAEIQKVDKVKILAAAKKYLHPDNMYIVEVANLKEAGE